jgi:hypothetical protein
LSRQRAVSRLPPPGYLLHRPQRPRPGWPAARCRTGSATGPAEAAVSPGSWHRRRPSHTPAQRSGPCSPGGSCLSSSRRLSRYAEAAANEPAAAAGRQQSGRRAAGPGFRPHLRQRGPHLAPGQQLGFVGQGMQRLGHAFLAGITGFSYAPRVPAKEPAHTGSPGHRPPRADHGRPGDCPGQALRRSPGSSGCSAIPSVCGRRCSPISRSVGKAASDTGMGSSRASIR